jgi:hypothetical protein
MCSSLIIIATNTGQPHMLAPPEFTPSKDPAHSSASAPDNRKIRFVLAVWDHISAAWDIEGHRYSGETYPVEDFEAAVTNLIQPEHDERIEIVRAHFGDGRWSAIGTRGRPFGLLIAETLAELRSKLWDSFATGGLNLVHHRTSIAVALPGRRQVKDSRAIFYDLQPAAPRIRAVHCVIAIWNEDLEFWDVDGIKFADVRFNMQELEARVRTALEIPLDDCIRLVVAVAKEGRWFAFFADLPGSYFIAPDFAELRRSVSHAAAALPLAERVLTIEFRLLAIFFVGCLGGTTFSIKWLVHSVAKCKWHFDRRYWRVFVPMIGGVYACVVLTLLDSGMIGAQPAGQPRSVALTTAFAFLIGYFSDGVSGLLSNVANAVFGTLERK